MKIRIVSLVLLVWSGTTSGISISSTSLSQLLEQSNYIAIVKIRAGKMTLAENELGECGFSTYEIQIEQTLKGSSDLAEIKFTSTSKLKTGAMYLVFLANAQDEPKNTISNSPFPYDSWEHRVSCIDRLPDYSVGSYALEIVNGESVILDIENTNIFVDKSFMVHNRHCISEEEIGAVNRCEGFVKYPYILLKDIVETLNKF